jgi:Do/DeqQ family serine protease
MNRSYLYSGIIALIVSIVTISVFPAFQKEKGDTIKIEHTGTTPTQSAVFTLDSNGDPIPLDFTATAKNVMDGVVHIKSTQAFPMNQSPQEFERQPNPFDDFFRQDPFDQFFNPPFFRRPEIPKRNNQPNVRVGQGSGVIISDDGYVVTNNHVVEGADDLEVTLHDNRTYKATIVGSDPTTDLALIRIKEKDLQAMPFVNSDDVKVGEWVMAVGNPFNLTSTVTAGIVSAKGRNINILKDQFAVESFIQTDAAINPGNSGGALVNLQGGLIGINTAIASPTGAYSGYGFAIPSNIVEKVVEDLMKYGVVQRGVLGVMIRTLDGNLMKEKDLNISTGVFVDSLLENSAAAAAGIQVGDVITSVDNIEVKSSPELQEIIARHRPGDEVHLLINRKGKEKSFKVTLNNRSGNTNIVEREHKELLSILGADLETLDKKAAEKLDLSGGVKVTRLYAGKLRKNTNMQEGFIITKVDGKKVASVDELIKLLEDKKGGVMIEGVYEDIPGEYYYAFGM